MRIVIAADHRGYLLKKHLISVIHKMGYGVRDLGTRSTKPVDYPDFAESVGLALLHNDADRGILICGSGVGVTVAANKFPGIRACLCHDTYSAHQGVEHDNMNVLVLGALVVSEKLAEELVRAFLNAHFDEAPRHARRIRKIDAIEHHYCAPKTKNAA